LRGGDLVAGAQASAKIDAEIGPKDHFRMENLWDQGQDLHPEAAHGWLKGSTNW